jgi:hypothetical protein
MRQFMVQAPALAMARAMLQQPSVVAKTADSVVGFMA